MTDAVYALVQVLHNLGAVAVVGGPAAVLLLGLPSTAVERRLATATLAAWALQAASGAGFGLASHFLKGALPEIAGVALAALAVKLAATAAGLVTGTLLARRRTGPGLRRAAWTASLAAGIGAVAAAAFLRWYL